MENNKFLNKDKDHLNNLFQKYASLMQHIKFNDVKADNSIILSILDYSIQYASKIINIDIHVKLLSMLVILNELGKPIDFLTQKYTSSAVVEKEITDFLSYYDDNYSKYVNKIDLFSDEFDRDYPFILDYINKKNAGELPPAS